MLRKLLRDDQWRRIEQLLPGKASDPGCTAKDNRLFVEAVLWVMRTGIPWRDQPPELGNWHSTYVRFSRWRDSGVWEHMAGALSGDADLEQLFIDSTIVRAHQHSAGAQKKPAARKSAAREAGRPPNCTLPSMRWAIRCASFCRQDRLQTSIRLPR